MVLQDVDLFHPESVSVRSGGPERKVGERGQVLPRQVDLRPLLRLLVLPPAGDLHPARLATPLN